MLSMAVRVRISLLTLALVLAGCRGTNPRPTTLPNSTTAPVVTGEPASAAPQAEATPAIALGDERRSEAGGFAFQAVEGYIVEEQGALIALTAPDADPALGPAFLLGGGPLAEPQAVDALFEAFLGLATRGSPDFEVGVRREIEVAGAPGLAAELVGAVGGQPLLGRMVVARPAERQGFVLIGAAPAVRWESETAALFDAVLNSVSFFEPVTPGPTPAEEPASGTPSPSP